MLNTFQKFLKSRSPSTIRWIVLISTLGIVIARAFNTTIRERIDILNFVLFCVALLAILRDDIKSLISKMKGVGFPGLQIPIEEIEDELEEVEEKYKNFIREYIDKDKFSNEHVLNYNNIYQSTIDLSFKIENCLEEIAKELSSESKQSDDIPKTTSSLLEYLIEKKSIGGDVYQIIKKYKKVVNKSHSEKDLNKITEFAIRILRLLQSILESIKDLKISSNRSNTPFEGQPSGINLGGTLFEQVDEEIISLYTTINLLDSKRNAFPLNQLTRANFTILEKKKNSKYKEASVINIVPLKDTLELRIILAIDISGSMDENRKLYSAKRAAISMIKKILGLNNKTKVSIALYPFNTYNINGFIDFGNGNIWSNSFQELERNINNLQASGGTPLLDALRFTIKELKDLKGYKAVICISDGIENSSKFTNWEQLTLIGKSSNVPVYSIGYGQDEYFPVLIEFSKVTNAGAENIGSFMKVSPEKLPNVLNYLSESIYNIYRIYWKPNSLSTKTQTFYKVRVEYETKMFGKICFDSEEKSYKLKS